MKVKVFQNLMSGWETINLVVGKIDVGPRAVFEVPANLVSSELTRKKNQRVVVLIGEKEVPDDVDGAVSTGSIEASCEKPLDSPVELITPVEPEPIPQGAQDVLPVSMDDIIGGESDDDKTSSMGDSLTTDAEVVESNSEHVEEGITASPEKDPGTQRAFSGLRKDKKKRSGRPQQT